MTAIARALSQRFSETRAEVGPLSTIVIFCGIGLALSLMLVACGFDLGANPF
jgi:hypothetical protein